MNVKFVRTLILVIFLFFLFTYIENSAFAQHKVLESLEKSITSLVESTKPSLVTIEGEIVSFPEKYFSRYRIKDSSYAMPSFIGSGVIYRADGYILTTTSVVRGMDRIKIILHDGRESKGKLVGIDDESNIAVLKVNVGGLKPAKLGNSDKVKPGSWVTVVGNSYGLPTAVSLGLVNGITEDGFIQMSVNVSPGNSGGPVLSTDGSVIGLVSARMAEPSYIEAMRLFTKAKGSSVVVIPPREIDLPTSGISLAIPINVAKGTALNIIKYGTIERGYLGIYPEEAENGILIIEVVEESPADKAGLQSGDIIIEFIGEKVKNEKQLRNLIASTRPEERVKMTILRNIERKIIHAVIGKAKPRFGLLKDKLLNLPPIPDVDLAIPEGPELELYYDAQQYQESQETYRQEIKKLKEEIRKINQEMKRLSKELQKSK